jgi:hypothetical protein
MRKPSILLTFLLASGILFPFCDFYNPCNCSEIAGDYFDIKGMTTEQINAGVRLSANQVVPFASYALYLHYDVDYVSFCHEKPFSFIQSAMACECVYDGYLGAKSERLETMQVITLNDFDSDHPANDTINDLISVRELGLSSTLENYLTQDTALIRQETLILGLTKAPTTNDALKLKIIVSLSNGENYETETLPVIMN